MPQDPRSEPPEAVGQRVDPPTRRGSDSQRVTQPGRLPKNGSIPSIKISAYLMYSIFFEVVIFAKLFLRWGLIAKKLQLLEHFIRFPATFYNQIRKTLTIFLIIGFISVVSSILYISTFDVTSNVVDLKAFLTKEVVKLEIKALDLTFIQWIGKLIASFHFFSSHHIIRFLNLGSIKQ